MIRLRSLIGLLAGIALVLGVASVAAQSPASTPTAPIRQFEIVAQHPHDTTAFTEGLVYIDGQLFEGTGLKGASELRRVDLDTGEVLQRHTLADQYFGEGVAVLGDKIYQLTWKSGTAFIYDRETFQQIGTFSYDTEGWGLTTDGSSLIMSDGTDQISFRDSETFAVTRTISVRDGDLPIANLNELEYIDGAIWANVWTTNLIARIDPQTGTVIDWLDLTALQQQMLEQDGSIDVLNGIAWNQEAGTVLVTGKWWPALFEIKLVADQ